MKNVSELLPADYYSTTSGWIIPFSSSMAEFGIDTEHAFGLFDIQPMLVKDPEARICVKKFAALLEYCNEQSGRTDFSIQVAKKFHPGMFHALGYAMLSSNSLNDALQRIVQYKRVVSNSCKLKMSEHDQNVDFEMCAVTHADSGKNVLSLLSCETFLATVIQLMRGLVGFNISPIKISIAFPKPDHCTQYLDEFFQCPIVFETNATTLTFDAAQLGSPLLSANTMISQTNEQILDKFLSRIDKHDLTYLIKNEIHDVLVLGAPSQIEIANKLGLSVRDLQRKLNNQGTSYKEILEQTRYKLTMDYVQQPHLSLSEISYLVGFSSVCNFNRAFKRWTDSTPGEFRKKITSQPYSTVTTTQFARGH